MPLAYDFDLQLKELGEISSRYQEWFLQIAAAVAYPEQAPKAEATPPRAGFENWVQENKTNGTIDKKLIESFEAARAEFVQKAQTLLQSVESNKVSYDDYRALVDAYSNFYHIVSLLEKEAFLQESGHDGVTWLRNDKFLARDLKREMERLARDGKPFSIAIARIDEFDKIQEAFGAEQAQEYVRKIASLIKKSMRSFDDAYRTGLADFTLTLKQSESPGGVKALERLQKILEAEQIRFDQPIAGRNYLSISCRVIEPVAGDHIDDIFTDLKQDLDTTEKEGDAVFECMELSPLQRFVQEH